MAHRNPLSNDRERSRPFPLSDTGHALRLAHHHPGISTDPKTLTPDPPYTTSSRREISFLVVFGVLEKFLFFAEGSSKISRANEIAPPASVPSLHVQYLRAGLDLSSRLRPNPLEVPHCHLSAQSLTTRRVNPLPNNNERTPRSNSNFTGGRTDDCFHLSPPLRQ